MNPFEYVDKGLRAIAEDEKILQNLNCNYNIVNSTREGQVFWKDLASHNSWRIQQNKIFGNCRLIDPYGDRRAWWGNKKKMLLAFQELAKNCNLK